MDFSESYRCTLLPAYSPDGLQIAIAAEYRLVIREVETLKVVQIFSCLDKIHSIEWSPTSKYVLCGLYDRSTVQVWSVSDPEWTCKIDEGPAGLKHCMWTPDGQSVLLVADFSVRITIWSLVDRKCSYLPGPKFISIGICFAPQGNALAVLERRDCKDWLSFYICSEEGWSPQQRTQLESMDAADVSYSPDGSCIAVADSCLYYKVLLYGLDGALLGKYSAYDSALGVRGMKWGPDGQLLAVGSYDQVARVLTSSTWQPLLECHHGSPLEGGANVVVYQELEEIRGVLAPLAAGQQQQQQKRETRGKYAIADLPVTITSITPATNKPNPKLGISLMSWSCDGTLLATVNENMPHAVWVWEVEQAELSTVLLHISPVKGVEWAPQGHSLAICTGSPRVYLWSPGGASVVHVPLPGFSAFKVAWGPGADSFVLMDKGAFCCAYVAGDMA